MPDPPTTSGKAPSNDSSSTSIVGESSGASSFVATGVEVGLAVKKTLDAYEQRKLLNAHNEQEGALSQSVSRKKSELYALRAQITRFESELSSPETDPMRVKALNDTILPGLRNREERQAAQLKEEQERLNKFLLDDKLEAHMAQEYGEKWKTERYEVGAQVTKSLLNSAKATTAFVGEGAKVAGVGLGLAAGGATILLSGKDLAKDIVANREALALKKKAQDALGKDGINDGIKKDDFELRAIADRMLLKQKKNSVEKGVSATKNAFGILGGAGSIMTGVAAAGLAGGALLTPVGWALAGAGAVAAVGYCGYKAYRSYSSNQIKQALRSTMASIDRLTEQDKLPLTRTVGDLKNGPFVTKDQFSAMEKVAEKVVKEQAKLGIKIKKEDVTLEQLRNYAPGKLLKRDTGLAATVLHRRFKQEVSDHFKGEQPTKEGLEQYLKAESLKQPVDSAVGLMSKMGVGLKAERALELYNSKETAAINFLKKNMYVPEKEEPTQKVKMSVRDQLRGGRDIGQEAPTQRESVGFLGKVRDSFRSTPTPITPKGASLKR